MKKLFFIFTLFVFTAGLCSPSCAEEKYILVDKWVFAGTGGNFSQPEAVTLNQCGDVYVADTGNNRIVKLTAQGKFIEEWGSFGRTESRFQQPGGIAVDVLGNIYVCDTGNERVQVFTSLGEYIGEVAIECSGIAVGPSRNVYIISGNTINQYSPIGDLLSEWKNVFEPPNAIAVDSEENVYVTVGSLIVESKVKKFMPEGDLIAEWGTTGEESHGSFRSPSGIAVDASGNVYVADTNNHRIQKFTSDGDFITQWDWRGTGISKRSYKPTGIAVDASGEIYVTTGDVVLKFRRKREAGSCIATHLLGADDPRVTTFRQFRDRFLTKSTAGKKIIKLHTLHGEQIINICSRHPMIKESAKRVLESVEPAVQLFLDYY